MRTTHAEPHTRPVLDLQGEEVAFTGRLASLTRAEAIELVQSLDGRYAPRITRNTTLVIVGQEGWPLKRDGRPTRKLIETRRLARLGQSVEVLPEGEFFTRIGLRERYETVCRRYTLDQLTQVVGVSRDRIRAWIRAGLVEPVETVHALAYFEFRQVAAVKLLCDLTEAGVSAARLRRSLRQLQAWLPDAQEGLARLDLLEGLLVVRRDDGRPVDLAGQLLLEFAERSSSVADLLRKSDRDSRSESPTAGPMAVSIDSLPPAVDDEDLFSRAVEYEEAQRFDDAAAAYYDWLARFAPDPHVCFNLGNCLSALGRPDAATERFRQAVELDREYVEAWNNLANALADEGRTEQAIGAWKRALELDPACSDALYNLADAMQEHGRPDEARHYWRAYLQHDAKSEWAGHARRCLEG